MKTISCSTCTDTSCVANQPTPCTQMPNPHHDPVDTMDLVIADVKRKHQAELEARYQQIGIETSKFYHMTGMMPHQVKESLDDNDLDFTKVRTWF